MFDQELPEYVSHKKVRAVKIGGIDLKQNPDATGQTTSLSYGAFLHHYVAGLSPIEVSAEYMHKHRPYVGGYYVKYEDGYESFSPAQAFELGYTKV